MSAPTARFASAVRRCSKVGRPKKRARAIVVLPAAVVVTAIAVVAAVVDAVVTAIAVVVAADARRAATRRSTKLENWRAGELLVGAPLIC